MYMLKMCSSNSSDLTTSQLPSSGDTIDVGIEYSPLSLYSFGDTLGGFNYDLMRLVASQHNLKINFHPIVSLTHAITAVEKGSFDILIAEMPTTSEFTDKFLFTIPIYLDRQVLIQSKSNYKQINTQLDLAGDTVWVVANSPFASRINNLAREIGDTIYVITDSIHSAEQLFILTATNEIKQAVINEQVAKIMAQDYREVDISTDISFSQFQSWIVNKNDSVLCDSLNSWLSAIKSTNQFQTLQERYLQK